MILVLIVGLILVICNLLFTWKFNTWSYEIWNYNPYYNSKKAKYNSKKYYSACFLLIHSMVLSMHGQLRR